MNNNHLPINDKMIIDPHIHSIYSNDARMSPLDIIGRSKMLGLDGIAIADHNTLKGSLVALKEAKGLKDFVVIPAMEVTTSKGHIVALGIQEEIQKGLSPHETVDIIREQAGIAIAPHPFVRYREGLFSNLKELDVDAIETLNSRYVVGYSNWRAKKLALKMKLPEIGSSDAHFLEAIGSCVTELEADLDVDSIIQGILSGKTSVYGNRTPIPLILREVINKKIKRI